MYNKYKHKICLFIIVKLFILLVILEEIHTYFLYFFVNLNNLNNFLDTVLSTLIVKFKNCTIIILLL